MKGTAELERGSLHNPGVRLVHATSSRIRPSNGATHDDI